MTNNKNFALEYAVSVINELIEIKKIEHKPFHIIWNTSLGYATAQTIRFDEHSNPILKTSTSYGFVKKEVFYPSNKNESNLFSIIRPIIMNYFSDGFGIVDVNLFSYPDLLLQELLNIININNIDELDAPEYSTVWNFKLLNSSFSIPFLNDDSLEIKAPVSLISEN